MKKSFNIFLILFSLIIFSCKKETIKQVVEVPTLRASTILDAGIVYDYSQQYKETHKDIAQSYFDKGVKEKDDNLEKASYYIKRAITLYPSTEFYKQLGELLEKSGKYVEATGVYNFLLYPQTRYVNNQSINLFIFDQPDEEIYSKAILNYWLAYGYLDSEVIYNAKSSGLNLHLIKDKLTTDPRFLPDTAGIVYKNFKFLFMSEEEQEAYQNSPANFHDMLASIKEKSSTFEIGKEQVSSFNYRKNGEWDEENYVPDFSSMYLAERQENPDAWYNFNYTNSTNIGDSVQVVIYAVDSSELACPVEMRHIYHRLVTYNNSGKLIDSKIVAYQSGEELATMKYENGMITVLKENRAWKNPYNKADFDNTLVKIDYVAVEKYSITKDGKIEPMTTAAIPEDPI